MPSKWIHSPRTYYLNHQPSPLETNSLKGSSVMEKSTVVRRWDRLPLCDAVKDVPKFSFHLSSLRTPRFPGSSIGFKFLEFLKPSMLLHVQFSWISCVFPALQANKSLFTRVNKHLEKLARTSFDFRKTYSFQTSFIGARARFPRAKEKRIHNSEKTYTRIENKRKAPATIRHSEHK